MENKKGIIWNEAVKDDGKWAEKVIPNAVGRFVERFGVRPDHVEVNVKRVPAETVIEGVRVVPVKYLLLNDCMVLQ